MASQELGKGASLVGLHDASNLFTATTVEGALKEAITQANAAFTSASNAKTDLRVAITGVDPSVVIPPEPTFPQLAAAIGQISTGKKWASGNVNAVNAIKSFIKTSGESFPSGYSVVQGLDFKPSYIRIRINKAVVGVGNLIVTYDDSYAEDRRIAYADNREGTTQLVRLDGIAAQVYNGGFTLPTRAEVNTAYFVYEWIAIK